MSRLWRRTRAVCGWAADALSVSLNATLSQPLLMLHTAVDQCFTCTCKHISVLNIENKQADDTAVCIE